MTPTSDNKTIDGKMLVAKAISTPNGYAKLVLKMNLHPKQVDMVESFYVKDKQTRISCCLANGCGKTACIAVVITLYALQILNAKVVYTSATWKQIHTQFLPSIKKYSHLFPDWTFLDSSINIKGIPRLICISTDQESNFQGHHSTETSPLVIIADESAGLPDAVWYAVDRCAPSSLVVLGSPLGPDNFFYKIETDNNIYKLYKHFRLTQPECSWVPKEQIDLMIAKWGKQHPLVLSSVFAEFAVDSENSIISLSSWTRCINNPPVYEPGIRRVTLDFAAGGDANVICYRNGNKIEIVKVWRDVDTMTAAGVIILELNRLKKITGLTQGEVYGDASGLGKPILDRLSEIGWRCNYFFGQAKPVDEHYKNSITECWLVAAKQIVNCSVILPNDDDLRGQLLGRKQRLNSSGRMELESKVEMKERGQPSPDVADAVAMCLGPLNAGELTNAYSRPPSPVMTNNNGGFNSRIYSLI